MRRFAIVIVFISACFLLSLKTLQCSGYNSSFDNLPAGQYFSAGSAASGNFAIRTINAPVSAIRILLKNNQRYSGNVQSLYFRNIPYALCSSIHSVTFFMLSGAHTANLSHISDYIRFRYLII